MHIAGQDKSRFSELKYFCPQCKKTVEMSLLNTACSQCGKTLIEDGAVFNFVQSTPKEHEKYYYDREYIKLNNTSHLTLADLLSFWERDDMPEHDIIRKEVGNLKGKLILLVGNGASKKELLFLEDNPMRLVFSDLSPFAFQAIQQQYDFSGHEETIRFAAIDAESLPFVDDSFDLVYGYGMVHHLPDVKTFIKGAHRVLKSGGKAVFFDDAFSWIWHYSKQTWLRPLMRYSHKRTGISPEDYRFSMSGGFKEADLQNLIRDVGGEPFFRRVNFFPYIWSRGVEKLLPMPLSSRLRQGYFLRMLVGIDRILGNYSIYKRNQIRLIWGFTKQ